MKKFFLFIFPFSFLFSQAQVTVQKTYGGTNESWAWSIEETNDNGFIMTGTTTIFSGYFDVYLLKTSSDGTLQWTKTFGGSSVSNDDKANSVIQTNDGGFILVGDSKSFGAGNYDIFLIKVSSDGSLQWSKTFGGSDDDEGYSVQQTNDGGFIITGFTYSFGAGGKDVFLLKTASDGTFQWSKTFGGTDDDFGQSILQINEGSFIIAGFTYSFGAGNFDGYLLKTDSNGNLIWSRTFGGTGYDGFSSVQQTKDGGFIFCGGKSWGGDIYLVKTDSDGHSGCNETIPNTITTSVSPIITNPSTQITSGGFTGNPATQIGNGGVETILCSTANTNDFQNSNLEIKISPNPFTEQTTINISGQSAIRSWQIELFDVYGRKVDSHFIRNSDSFVLRRDGLPSGIYFLRVSDVKKFLGNQKIIITDLLFTLA